VIVSKRTVNEALEIAVQHQPNKPFLYYGDQAVTYRELDDISDRLACSFLRRGIKRGDRIAVVAMNQPEWIYTYFAAVKIGASVVALNVRYRAQEFEYMLNNSQTKALVCLDEVQGFRFTDFFRDFKDKVPTVTQYYFIGDGNDDGPSFQEMLDKELDRDLLDQAKEAVQENDTAIIIYTSGTTGRPKGTMITNRSILASAQAQVNHCHYSDQETMIGSMPLNHVGGITCTMMTALLCQGSVVLLPGFDPAMVLQMIERYKATVFGGVPTMYLMLFNHPDFEKYDLSSLRFCAAGGSNVEVQLAKDIASKLPNATLLNLYGLSESSGAAVLSGLSDDAEKVAASIGVMIGDFQAKVVGLDGEELPFGEIGELLIKGDCVANGYFGLQEESQEAFTADGWLYTGDMVILDETGYIYFKGRKKEMYIQSGYNVYPVEVENLLTTHPKISIAAGIGVPDSFYGEVGRYYITPKPGMTVTEEELTAFCRENLADYKVPKQFVFSDSLPLTPAGKIQKSLLKQRFAEIGE
jgi:acyl-CoA synthetase (AMP-forming)/AMP-acid ligase II